MTGDIIPTSRGMCKKSRKRSNRNVFDPSQSQWSYRAEAADVLRTTQLPISSERFAARQSAATACVTHDSGYWAAAMAGQNFAVEDRLDTAEFNTALWRGLGSGPEPRVRDARNLGHDRPARTKDIDAAPCASLNASIP